MDSKFIEQKFFVGGLLVKDFHGDESFAVSSYLSSSYEEAEDLLLDLLSLYRGSDSFKILDSKIFEITLKF